jgi:S-methylmethionine-dependent homocysteine/selenocysteine methylase
MSRPEAGLPQLGNGLFLSDGGIETFLVFQEGIELPQMAAYTLLATDAGTGRLRSYFEHFLKIAAEFGTGFVLESPTWRANPDWAARVGTSPRDLVALNRRAIDLLVALREEYADRVAPMVISGCVGPRADAYRPEEIMSEADAAQYHATQIGAFHGTAADMVTGVTITNVPEAIGIVRAAQDAGLPVVISFTVETDGTLPTGPTLAEAIERVDATTDQGPAYYMVNCAHPTHVEPALTREGDWTERLRGLRANASSKSHAELDEAPELHRGDPAQLGSEYRSIRDRFPHLNVLGGCCGTDHHHVRAIAQACLRR